VHGTALLVPLLAQSEDCSSGSSSGSVTRVIPVVLVQLPVGVDGQTEAQLCCSACAVQVFELYRTQRNHPRCLV